MVMTKAPSNLERRFEERRTSHRTMTKFSSQAKKTLNRVYSDRLGGKSCRTSLGNAKVMIPKFRGCGPGGTMGSVTAKTEY